MSGTLRSEPFWEKGALDGLSVEQWQAGDGGHRRREHEGMMMLVDRRSA